MSGDVPTSLLCKNILWSFEIFELYINFSNLVQWVFLHYNLFKYSFKNSSKCLEMSVDAYNSTSCKNPVMFFGKFECINPFFILVQFGDLYCNLIFLYSSNPELFPTCSPPYKTLKSRRLGSLEVFKCMF